jgi:hypothetical protein
MIRKGKLAWCISILVSLLPGIRAQGQSKKIDLGNAALWQIYGREQPAMSKDSIVFRAEDPDGLLLLKNETVGDAIIEFDLRGRNEMDQSFVGLAFNVQDEKHFELVYFRPFNFFNPDTMRRPRSVQYTYEPEFPWQKLRAAHPGKYENRLTPTPDPDRWFHVKLVIAHPSIKIYVNNNPTPCLTVESLSPFSSGKIGFHVGPRTRASFANLTITPTDNGSKASYGNNPAGDRS